MRAVAVVGQGQMPQGHILVLGVLVVAVLVAIETIIP
jgi:hypothetical protein